MSLTRSLIDNAYNDDETKSDNHNKNLTYKTNLNNMLNAMVTNGPVIRKNKRSRRKRGKNPLFVLTQIENKPVQTRAIRYIGSAVNDSLFIVKDILEILAFVIPAGTTAYRLFESVRIRSISITLLGEADATGVGFLSFSWLGNNAPHEEDEMIYAVGESSRHTYYPPSNSLASFWFSDDSDTTEEIFQISLSATTGTVILDISFEYVLKDGALTTFTISSAAGITGIVAPTLPLSTDTFVPCGLVTVTR